MDGVVLVVSRTLGCVMNLCNRRLPDLDRGGGKITVCGAIRLPRRSIGFKTTHKMHSPVRTAVYALYNTFTSSWGTSYRFGLDPRARSLSLLPNDGVLGSATPPLLFVSRRVKRPRSPCTAPLRRRSMR